MAKANPLKKITAEAKRIRKRKPKTSWKSAIKQAGKKFRDGKIRSPRKKKAGAVSGSRKKATKRKKSRARKAKKPVTAVAIRKTTTTVRARKVGRSAPVKRHRMAGGGGNGGNGGGTKKLLMLGLLVLGGFLIWKALKPKTATLPPGTPPLIQTSNPVRNTQTNDIVQYALAAGLAFDAIARLIQSLNNRSDDGISDIYDELDRGGTIPATLYA